MNNKNPAIYSNVFTVINSEWGHSAYFYFSYFNYILVIIHSAGERIERYSYFCIYCIIVNFKPVFIFMDREQQ